MRISLNRSFLEHARLSHGCGSHGAPNRSTHCVLHGFPHTTTTTPQLVSTDPTPKLLIFTRVAACQRRHSAAVCASRAAPLQKLKEKLWKSLQHLGRRRHLRHRVTSHKSLIFTRVAACHVRHSAAVCHAAGHLTDET